MSFSNSNGSSRRSSSFDSFPNWIPLEQWKNEKSKKRTIDTQQQQQSIVTSFSSINQDDASTTTTTSNGSKLAKKRKITNSPPPTQPTQPSQPINFLHNFPTNGTGPTFFMTTTTTTLMINQPPQPPPPSTTTTTQFPPSFLSLQTPQTPQTPQLPMIRQSSSIPLDDLFPDLLSKVGAGDHHSDNDHETSINSPTISPQDLSSLLTSPEGHQQQIDGMEQSHSIPPSISDDHWAYSTTTTTTSAAAMRVRRSSRNVNQNEIENENENQNETSYTNEEEQDHHSLNTPTLSMPIDDTLLSPTESISTPETPNDDDSTTTSPTNTIIKSSNKGGTLKSGGARKRGKTPNVRTDFPTNLKVIGRESFLDYQQIMAMKAPEHKVDAFELFKVLAKNLKKWKEIKAALYPVFKIQPHSDSSKTTPPVVDHRIRNAINYRFGILPTIFPHLQWYSTEARDYKYSILSQCPEILLSIESEEHRKRFLDVCSKYNKPSGKPNRNKSKKK